MKIAMTQDIPSKLFNPRFSNTETFIIAGLSLLIGWYSTMNLMMHAQQRMLYETSVFVRANYIAETLLQNKDEAKRIEFAGVMNDALQIARDQIPAPRLETSSLKIVVFGPDDDYIEDLRNAIRSASRK